MGHRRGFYDVNCEILNSTKKTNKEREGRVRVYRSLMLLAGQLK